MKVDLNIEDINKIEDPIQRQFILDLKSRIESGESINPQEVLTGLTNLASGSVSKAQMERLNKLNTKLSELVEPISKMKM